MPGRVQFTVEAGQRFGRGVVVEPEVRIITPGRPSGYRGARLRCDCGSEYTARPDRLIGGHVRSCGCLQSELARATGRQNRTHGLSRHPLYDTWYNMLERCENPADYHYPTWGGRGIRVCDRWHKIGDFIADIERDLGERPAGHSIDRIDNDGHYEPGNVRWATAEQQARNRRT